MQRCPCCNARLKETITCPRCKADLQDIIRTQHLADSWYQKAIDHYLNNELQHCVDALTQSLQLHHSDSALLFRAFVRERQTHTILSELQDFVQITLSHSTPLLNQLLNKVSARFAELKHLSHSAKRSS